MPVSNAHAVQHEDQVFGGHVAGGALGIGGSRPDPATDDWKFHTPISSAARVFARAWP